MCHSCKSKHSELEVLTMQSYLFPSFLVFLSIQMFFFMLYQAILFSSNGIHLVYENGRLSSIACNTKYSNVWKFAIYSQALCLRMQAGSSTHLCSLRSLLEKETLRHKKLLFPLSKMNMSLSSYQIKKFYVVTWLAISSSAKWAAQRSKHQHQCEDQVFTTIQMNKKWVLYRQKGRFEAEE